MKSSLHREDACCSNKYGSFSNSDSTKNINKSIGANQYMQPWQQQRQESTKVDIPIEKSDIASLKTSRNFHSVQPCPFTFLSAVKRKLVLKGNHSTCKKVYEPEKHIKEVPKGMMEFLKPLKVPDLKISSKNDFSSRESLISSEEFLRKTEAVQRDEISLKNTDRVPRKLEFSSSSATSMLNYENLEPLKIPEMSMTKKKDLSRDSSREKENRSKRVKKEDSNSMISSDLQDISKWSKGQRHISRKEIADAIINKKLNDRILAHGPKGNDAFKKTKTKNFTTSTVRKDEEKRHKHSNIPSNKTRKDKSLDSKSRTSSSESLHPLDKGTRLHDKILIREGYKAMISEIYDQKYKDDSQILSKPKQIEDQKYKSHSETRVPKHQGKSIPLKPIDILSRESKRIVDKQKSSSKTDSKHSSEISEDLTTAVTSIASLKSQSILTEKTSKSRDIDKSSLSSSNRNTEEPNYSEVYSSAALSNSASGNSIETKMSQDTSMSEKLMDPLRISFRDDSYSNQPEFADLITPDINLKIRSKRRKQFLQERDNDEFRDAKQSPVENSQDIGESQLMNLQAEKSLLDSFSQSLRQVIDVERTKIANDEVKRHMSMLKNDEKSIDYKSISSEPYDAKDKSKSKSQKSFIKVVEVQTQTVNDIATQTETTRHQRGVSTNLVNSRDLVDTNDIPHLSLNSEDRYEDMDRVEDITLPSKMRAMSEISLHETTSSIKTETGTEISISTRGVTCSFNKYLDLEMAQLINDEKQRFDKIEMLFKSREKTLNDRTKKLVKLEEQKRALRDTGQDSRISSVKKKQRALLLKLQQEKDEMNRLKELHKIASQERKLMLQKQRDMFNPEMSTKNILNKLKRSADNQSPRRLSGPMKGYDIRSNSSISSLIDSDKSQFDRSQFDLRLNLSDISTPKNDPPSSRLESLHNFDIADKKSKIDSGKSQKDTSLAKLKYDLKTKKFEEKMPKMDQLKTPHYDLDAILKHGATAINMLKNENCANLSQEDDDKSVAEALKSESDAFMEEFTQIWKTQFPDLQAEHMNFVNENGSEALEDLHRTSCSKKLDKESNKKLQSQKGNLDSKITKRKGTKAQKSNPLLIETASKIEDSHYFEEILRHHHNKRSKIDSEQQSDENYQNSMLEELDFNESQSSLQALLKHSNLLNERNQQLLQDIVDERNSTLAGKLENYHMQRDEQEKSRGSNTSAKSQVSLTISHQSSNDSDSYSRSVVIRSQQDHHGSGLKTSKKLEQILKAREATLVSRRNCVEDWIAWHARLRNEENRVARMEQAAYKLVSATAKALSHNDSTVSSDTSDVEGRIEVLTQKLADRRLEMARLKKEARKQAKQRLRALETNLLNQIKKYDATIIEMRKKLEAKKNLSKDADKLAIEPKSVTDFKVPEISIKKIQEIYKNSDLLRSKSDSDIIAVKYLGKDEKSKSEKARNDKSEKDSAKSQSTSESKPVSTLYTVYDEERESSEKSDNSALHSIKTKSNSEEISTQRSIATEIQDIKRSSSQSSNISEEIPSEAYSVKSQSDPIQTAKTSEALSSQYISERIETSHKDLKGISNIEEELTSGPNDISLIFSKKLDHIQLNNKELNDDIYNLENDLKELTEMMSNYSKKSDEKSSKSFEEIQKSPKEDNKDILKNHEKSSSSDVPETTALIVQSENIDEDLQTRVKKILSDVIPDTEDLLTSIEELDVQAKSKEILDEVEKSILSEHIKLSNETDEIHTYLTPSPTVVEKSLLDSKNSEKELAPESKILLTIIGEDKELSLQIEPQQIVNEKLNLLDINITSEIETECFSKSENISAHIQQSNSDESLTLSKRDGYSVDNVLSSKIKEKLTTEDGISTASKDKHTDTKVITPEKISTVQVTSLKNIQDVIKTDQIKIQNQDKVEIDATAIEDVNDISSKENVKSDDPFVKTASSDNDWTLSDSFEIQQIDDKNLETLNRQFNQELDLKDNKDEDKCGISDIEDSALFIPKGESTNLQETFVLKLDESSRSRIGLQSEEFNDILEIIDREIKRDDELALSLTTAPVVLNTIDQTLSKIDVKVDSPVECDVSITIKTVNDDSEESIEEEIESRNESSASKDNEDNDLPKIQIGVKIKLIEEDNDTVMQEEETSKNISLNEKDVQTNTTNEVAEDRGSSDGEQLDNLIEVAEGKLDTLEKLTPLRERIVEGAESTSEKPKTHVTVFLDKTFEVIKDPGYEDISEESLEISEILDKSGLHAHSKSKKFTTIPEKYIIKSKSDEVLRILDEISNKSSTNFKDEHQDVHQNEENKVLLKGENLTHVNNNDVLPSIEDKLKECNNLDLESRKTVESESIQTEDLSEDKLIIPKEVKLDEQNKNNQQKPEDSPKVMELSDGLDTPRGVSDIEMDSPRETHENSRLDVDALDDDLLSGNSLLHQEAKTEFRITPMGLDTEKDIKAMIDKLNASLKQPGIEVAELEAKLLQIENLQIELEIKKLEAEEVSYYVREIPNKPPPPYTPPGAVRHSSAHGSPSPPPAVIPTNVEELTTITEKATALIYQAKQCNEDILSLEAPAEICEFEKDNCSEAMKADRRIYNAFLFDLCKEIIAEMYKAEHESPGPSWTKPNAKMKPTVKIARTLDELNDYVSKEVATLFGFKTKLQRENMVMRWSRKRRDRVDELLAKEAQAEEKEWTKFHHDELAVKNNLTKTILDTLILETVSCIKATYAKKRKVVKIENS